MSIRIGFMVFSVNALFLAAAFAYFVMLSHRHLYPAVFNRRRGAMATLAIVSLCGIIGASIYGRVGAAYSPHPSGMPPSVVSLGAGSFGGYWGVLIGSIVVALIMRRNVLPLADAFVPAMLIGGAIARMTDLVTGSVRGVTVHPEILSGIQPFRHWPAFDVAAQLLTLWIASIWCRRERKPGTYLIAFLSIYGASRFGLECIRDTYHWIGPLTHGHVLAAIQCVAGMALWIWFTRLNPNSDGLGDQGQFLPRKFSAFRPSELL